MDMKERALTLPSWTLTERQVCDIELILNGAFAPLTGFLNKADYDSVVHEMHLQSGELWPIPVTLDVTETFSRSLEANCEVALHDPEGDLIAILQVESLWQPDKTVEAQKVFGTTDDRHPGVHYLRHIANDTYLGGKLIKAELPLHYDYRQHRHTPDELKAIFEKRGWHRIAAFQTSSPIHRAQQEMTSRAASELEANLLIHPSTGFPSPDDIDHFTRVRCYEHIIPHYPEQTTMFSLVNLANRMAGPREIIWHALINKNHGCTHFLVPDNYATPGTDQNGQAFYNPHQTRELVEQYRDRLGIEIVNVEEMVYVQELTEFVPSSLVPENSTASNISDSELRRRLYKNLDIPNWFSLPSVIAELKRSYPPRHKQGFTVFFTGLSGSGKSTVANALRIKLLELGGRPVTLLDGDIVRKNLSSELTFSKEHRDLNIKRIGFVASEITKNGGIAICAPIAPYTVIRRQVRNMIEPVGGFVEVYIATPIEECERRDRKGLYAKARAGIVKGFTGIDDPYEAPQNAELVFDTSNMSPDECAHMILLRLEKLGFIKKG